MNSMKKSDLVLSLPQRLILLFCVFLICYILTMVGAYVLGRLFSDDPAKALRISAVLRLNINVSTTVTAPFDL